MREIKFKFWQKEDKEMSEPYTLEDGFTGGQPSSYCFLEEDCIALQYTGLKDKNSLTEVYEGDIIDTDGNIKGNIYETNKEKTDLVIQGFGTKDWFTTYTKAVERGCQES